MVYKLFIEVGRNLANHTDRQLDNLLSLQWWKRPQELARTAEHHQYLVLPIMKDV